MQLFKLHLLSLLLLGMCLKAAFKFTAASPHTPLSDEAGGMAMMMVVMMMNSSPLLWATSFV